MRVLINLPMSGTHYFASMMQAVSVGSMINNKTQPSEQFMHLDTLLDIVNDLKFLRNDKTYAIALPYSQSMENTLRGITKFLLIRDPRDIIVSHATSNMDISSPIELNYTVSNCKLYDLPVLDRIDYLIDVYKPLLELFDLWVGCSGLELFNYDEYVMFPELTVQRLSELGYGTFTDIVQRVNFRSKSFVNRNNQESWIYTMTSDQQKRCKKSFGHIIEKWTSL